MTGIGVTGYIVILLVALLLFGPKKLPELGSSIGKAIHELRKSAKEISGDEVVKTEETKTDSSK